MTGALRFYVLARVAFGLLLVPFDHTQPHPPFIHAAPLTHGVRGRR
jgi:hypothetical protein